MEHYKEVKLGTAIMICISVLVYLWNAELSLQTQSPGALKHFVFTPRACQGSTMFVLSSSLVSLVNFVLTENNPPLYVDVTV